MSGKTKTCVVIVCDDCKSEHEHDYTPHWDSLAEGREETVEAYEWWTDGADLDLCQHCKQKPHSFVADRDDEDICGRCGVERGEHQEDHERIDKDSGIDPVFDIYGRKS